MFVGLSSTLHRLSCTDAFKEPNSDVALAGTVDGPEYDVLVRCIHGDHLKFTSRVRLTGLLLLATDSRILCFSLASLVQIPASRLLEFHALYGNLLKSSMAPSMRKRDKKREKLRADSATKKKKELYVDVVVGNQGKRGKGRRQRVRSASRFEHGSPLSIRWNHTERRAHLYLCSCLLDTVLAILLRTHC